MFILLSFLAAGVAFAGSPDLEGHWAQNIVETAEELGFVEGCPDQSFGPDEPVSRAEFVKMALASGGVDPVKKNAGVLFKDVPGGHWAFPYLEAATVAGVVYKEDYPDGAFGPGEAISREEMADICHRLLAKRGDLKPVSSVAPESGLARMVAEGILHGYPDGSLGGESAATRAETCAVALRLKMKLLEADASAECRWLTTAQSPEGFISLAGERPDIIPYFTNLSALALCDDATYRDAVKAYLEWTMAHLNPTDKWGLAGTIYDYQAVDGKNPVSMENYDSADSYAATALSLAAAYYRTTKDAGFIEKHYRELAQVAAVILTLQDSDGLVWSKPNLQVKYLMDNCECCRGLADWSGLLADLGCKDLALLYGRKAEQIKRAVENQFWDEGEACYAWAIDQEGKRHLPQAGHSYPGAFAQVYPVLFGAVSPDSGKAILAYQRLYQELPEWPALQVQDPFPWALLGLAAVQMDDLAGASMFMNNCRNAYIENGHPFPWSTFEGGFYTRTAKMLQEKIGERAF
jgi:hypothetical protein